MFLIGFCAGALFGIVFLIGLLAWVTRGDDDDIEETDSDSDDRDGTVGDSDSEVSEDLPGDSEQKDV